MSSDVIQIRAIATGLSIQDAEERIRAVVMVSKNVGFTDHANDQMIERDISSRQVWEVMKGGKVVKKPEWNDEHDDWICVLRKRTSGRTVSVVVGLDEDNKMTVVTTYG